MSPQVSVSVNGEPRTLDAGTALDRLVATLTTAPSGVAAAVNECVVPRGRWAATTLPPRPPGSPPPSTSAWCRAAGGPPPRSARATASKS